MGNFQDDFLHLECPPYQGVRECGGALLLYQASDEAETLDVWVITQTIRAVARGTESIIDGTDTPTRIVLEE